MEEDAAHQWQTMLYQKISKKDKEKHAMNMECSVSRMLVMAKVLFGLHLVSALFFICLATMQSETSDVSPGIAP